MTSPYTTIAAVLTFTNRFDKFTRREFAEGTGLSRATTERMVTALHRRGVIRVCEWIDDIAGRNCIAVYTVGAGPDAKRRARLTGRQREKAYEARKKARAAGALALAMAAMTRQTETEEA